MTVTSPPLSAHLTDIPHDLRRRAEARVEAESPLLDASQVLHDLRVHQIELEMQNDELRRTEAALEVSRARYFDLYDLAPVGYITVSEAGVILEANFTAARLLGITRGTLVHHAVSDFILAEDQDSYYLHRRRLFATGVPEVVELRLRREDGTHFWARIDATTAPDTEAGTEVCRATVSDISDRKRLEDERLQFERELQQAQKMESLARMAGAIAHHFNNQLGVVMGNVELAQRSDVRTGYLDEALSATRKAASVSGLLLTYLGQSSGNHAPLDVSRLCTEILPLLRAAAPANVTIDTRLPEPGPTVNGNAAQLQLLLTNLVTNAREAVGDVESTVYVALTVVAGADIPTGHRVPARWIPSHRPYACLAIVDQGCGIEAQDLERIFDPFFTNKFLGRGLGLPVVLGILHAHDGGLVMESHHGQQSGSVFRVFLPITTESVPRPPEARQPMSPFTAPGPPRTVLLVDDDECLRRVTSRTLSDLGCVVLEASDGAEGLELFRQHRSRIGLVLCDLTMPHMDGWETLSAIRVLSPDVPIILASGYDEAHVMADDREERPQVFLPKPFGIEQLREAIQRALVPGA